MAEITNRILASFYGLAFGDSLGGELSTLSHVEIAGRFPVFSEVSFDETLEKFSVGDETQTALYAALAVRNANSDNSYKEEFIRHLLFWFDDPVGNSHASQHLLNALERLKGGIHWTNATNISLNRSDVMARSSAIAYWMAVEGNNKKYWPLSQLLSALTHGHPVTLTATALYVEALVQLLKGKNHSELLNHLLGCIPKVEAAWDNELLEDLWKIPGCSSPAEFLRKGSEQCQIALESVELHLKQENDITDVCELFGEGRSADEALAIALYCFLKNPDYPEIALKRSVYVNGPSDILGSLTGALAGAACTSDGWPSQWYSKIDYKDEILEMSRIIGRGALI